jgi:hypothetical protein
MSTVSYTFDAKFDVDVPLLIVGAGAAPAHCFIPKAVSRSTAPVVSGAKTGTLLPNLFAAGGAAAGVSGPSGRLSVRQWSFDRNRPRPFGGTGGGQTVP